MLEANVERIQCTVALHVANDCHSAMIMSTIKMPFYIKEKRTSLHKPSLFSETTESGANTQ